MVNGAGFRLLSPSEFGGSNPLPCIPIMKLSIIIPTLNEEKYLPKLLESIKAQGFEDYEIIVSDGKSKDKTRKLAKKFGCKVVDGIGRPGIGRNKGAKIAKGEYYLFLDADVILTKNFLNEVIEEFEKRNLDIGFCNAQPLEDTLGNRLYLGIYFVFNSIMQFIKPFGAGFCLLVRRDLHNKLGGFNEKLYYLEDVDYIQRSVKIGKFRVLKPQVLMSMRRYIMEGKWNSLARYVRVYLYRVKGKEVTGKLAGDRKFYYAFDYKKD